MAATGVADFGYDLGVNLLSEFIFLFAIIFIAWIFYWLNLTKPLREFFKVGKGRRFVIYLSQLRPIPGGTIGVDGQPRSATSPLASFGEIEVAFETQAIFRGPLPFLQHLPEFLSDFFIAAVNVFIKLSPIPPNQIESEASFLTLGSPGYNSASLLVESYPQGFVCFDPAYSSFVVNNIPAFDQPTYGFVQRLGIDSNQRVAFYVAGPSEFATVGAARYLTRNWRKLRKRYRANDFVVVLSFDAQHPDKPTVVMQT